MGKDFAEAFPVSRAVFDTANKVLGFDLATVPLSDLGRAKRVVVDADNTTIVQGSGNAAAVSGRAVVKFHWKYGRSGVMQTGQP